MKRLLAVLALALCVGTVAVGSIYEWQGVPYIVIMMTLGGLVGCRWLSGISPLVLCYDSKIVKVRVGE